jgi:hypothetical protein
MSLRHLVSHSYFLGILHIEPRHPGSHWNTMANALFHGMTVDYSETWYVDQMKEARLGSRAIHMEFIGFMETHGTGSNGGNELFDE